MDLVAVQQAVAIAKKKDAIERQRIRQDSDRRAKGPLAGSVEPVRASVSTSADGSLTKAYYIDVTAQTNGSVAVASGAQLLTVPFDYGTPQFQKQIFKSGANAQGYLYSGPSKVNAVQPSPANPISMQEIRVRSNAPRIAFLLYRFISAFWGQQLFVNGLPVTMRPMLGVGIADYVYLDFADSNMRDIAIRTPAALGAIYVGPNYEVVKPNPRTGLVMYSIGPSYDSPVVFTDAGGSTGNTLEGLSQGLEDGLGISEHYVDGVAGTGWTIAVSAGAQGPSNSYVDRWPQVLRANPDVLRISMGAANDCYNLVSNATIIAALKPKLQAYRNNNLTGKIIWDDGPTPPDGGNYASNASRYISLRNAMLADTDLQAIGIYYVDTTALITGTGHAPSPNNSDGPSNWMIGNDTFHGTNIGYRAMRTKLREKYRMILVDDGTLLNTVI